MIEITITFTTGYEETHTFENQKTIQYTCPDGAKVRTIKIKKQKK